MTLIDKQKAIEHEAERGAIDKYHRDLLDAMSQGRFEGTREGRTLMKILFEPINSKIAEYLGTKYNGHTLKLQNYIKLMSDDSKEITFVVIKSLVNKIAQSNNKVPIPTMAGEIIFNLKRLHFFNRLKKDNPKLHSYLGAEYRKASARRKEMLVEKHIRSLYEEADKGTTADDIRAGAQLISIVLLSGIDFIRQHTKTTKRKRTESFVSLTNEVLEILFSYKTEDFTLTMPPMIVEPRDWTSLTNGGYLEHKLNFVKVSSKRDLRALESEDLSKVYPIINKLQKTPWRVNTRVADVIQHIFDNNLIDPKSPRTLPRCYGEIPTPNVIEVEDLIEAKEYKLDATPAEKDEWHKWNKQREHIRIGLDGEKGRRLQFLLTMRMMTEMRKYERFWYVYQLDYRGRVYPYTDFFNPQSKGYVKSMLEFADGKELDETGVKWLKIHIANSWGLDKEPFNDRLKWAMYNSKKFLDVANDPIGTLKEWTEADSPYEFLAGCFAFKDYIEGKPVHVPIQLDAVNSGIQFYSGLLLDKEGAESCCVIGNTRSDLYGMVAARANKKLELGEYPHKIVFNDSEGVEKVLSTKVEAESLKGKITRSMTKTNVMTVPYSVTMRGMKMQNWNTMDTMRLQGKEFWEGDDWVVNYLLTELNYESIFEIVKGARVGQQFLRDLASNLDVPAKWHTPIYGFPVIQQTWTRKSVRVSTPLGALRMFTGSDVLNRQKQLSSIAANYIHSIDSTLLLYCVQHMKGDIGVIHDCFLVHPNDGEQIRNHYKEGYISIMSSNPFEQVAKELDPEGLIEVPCIGTLNLDEVRDSMYIIS